MEIMKLIYYLIGNSKGNKFYLILIDCLILTFSYFSSLIISFSKNYYLENFTEKELFTLISLNLFISLIFYILTNHYNSLTRFTNSKILIKISLRNIFLSIVLSISIFILNGIKFNFLNLIYFWYISTTLMFYFRYAIKFFLWITTIKENSNKSKIAIYGAGYAANMLASILYMDKSNKIVCFFDDNAKLWGRTLFDKKIYSPEEIIRFRGKIDYIVLAIMSIDKKQKLSIERKIKDLDIPLIKLPSLHDLKKFGGINNNSDITNYELEKYLRNERGSSYENEKIVKEKINQNVIFITGGGGSIGSELVKQVINLSPKSLIILESNEYALYKITQELKENKFTDIEVISILGDATNKNLIKGIFSKYTVNIIYHAAAYKHVSLVEENPLSGIENNVYSTKVLCEEAFQAEVDSFTFISTDKAVRPTNVMGASKRLGEQIVQGYAELAKINNLKSKFSLVRFGNVIGSSGSVIPLFKKQIERGGPITITHKDVIRYFMTIKEAVHLVLYSSALSKGGEIFLLDMGKPIKVLTLAKRLIEISGLTIKDKINPKGDISIEFIGLREGEKLYEELLISGKPQTTDHPLIFKAQEKFICLEELKDSLDEMELYLKETKKSLVLKKLKQVVPEWESTII